MHILVAVLLLHVSLAGVASADPLADASFLAGVRGRVLERVLGMQQEGSLRTSIPEDMAARAKSMAEAMRAGIAPALGLDAGVEDAAPRRRVVIYVSLSQGDAELSPIFDAAAGRNVRIIFRGVPPGATIGSMMRRAMSLANGPETPEIGIDPSRFKGAGIQRVPVITLEEELDGHTSIIARAAGIANIDWFLAETDQGRTGDLGTFGTTRDILEPDLIEELQRRAADLDWKGMKHRAIERFWTRAKFETLPAAKQGRERTVDPTIEVAQDITTPDGTVVAVQGTLINPLEIHPFQRRLIVFDGRVTAQIEKARELGRESTNGERPVYLVTEFDREHGWEAFKDLQKTIGSPVYLLTRELRERFALEHTISVVTASGSVFRVREISIDPGATQ